MRGSSSLIQQRVEGAVGPGCSTLRHLHLHQTSACTVHSCRRGASSQLGTSTCRLGKRAVQQCATMQLFQWQGPSWDASSAVSGGSDVPCSTAWSQLNSPVGGACMQQPPKPDHPLSQWAVPGGLGFLHCSNNADHPHSLDPASPVCPHPIPPSGPAWTSRDLTCHPTP